MAADVARTCFICRACHGFSFSRIFLCIQFVFDVIVSAVLTAIRLELRYILAGADDRSLQQKKSHKVDVMLLI